MLATEHLPITKTFIRGGYSYYSGWSLLRSDGRLSPTVCMNAPRIINILTEIRKRDKGAKLHFSEILAGKVKDLTS